MAYCYKCGNELAPGAAFCSKCGAPVKRDTKRCPDCGETVPFDERECPACGHVFAAGTETSAQARTPHPPRQEATQPGTAAQKPGFDFGAAGKGLADVAAAAGKTIAGAASVAGKGVSEGAASVTKSVASHAKPKDKPSAVAPRSSESASRIRRCPNCGETIGSFVTICPACGYELRGDEGSGSVRDFARRLEEVSAMSTQKVGGLGGLVGKNAYTAEEVTQRKIDLIKGYPIPNTREDICEFMILASSNYDVGDDSELSRAWEAKFEQAYQKARIAFGNTAYFDEIQSIYNAKEHQRDKKKKAKAFTILAVAVVAVIGVVMMIVGEFAGSASGDNNSPFYMLVVLGIGVICAIAIFLSDKKDKRQ